MCAARSVQPDPPVVPAHPRPSTSRVAGALVQSGTAFAWFNITGLVFGVVGEEPTLRTVFSGAFALAVLTIGWMLSRRPDALVAGAGHVTLAFAALSVGAAVLSALVLPAVLRVGSANGPRAPEPTPEELAVAATVTASTAAVCWWWHRSAWLFSTMTAATVAVCLAALAAVERLEQLTAAAALVLLGAAFLTLASRSATSGARQQGERAAVVVTLLGTVVLAGVDPWAGVSAGLLAAGMVCAVSVAQARSELLAIAGLGLVLLLTRGLVPDLGVADGIGVAAVSLGVVVSTSVLAANRPGRDRRLRAGGSLVVAWLLACFGSVVLAFSAGTGGIALSALTFGLLLAAAASAAQPTVVVLAGIGLFLTLPAAAAAPLDGVAAEALALVTCGVLVLTGFLVRGLARQRQR